MRIALRFINRYLLWKTFSQNCSCDSGALSIVAASEIRRKMIILTNKAGPSSAPFMILLLVSISHVFGCGVIPGGQTSTRTFTAQRAQQLTYSRGLHRKQRNSYNIPWYCNQQGCCSGTCTTFCNANSSRCSRNRRSESTLA
ncbi:hypothetical protein KIN20_027208 [Parelaphostrongylus tenuis]|uniref:Uncharacterized protein n=1 Tax=Parelaphostrongylus tenuis TaxID=148309 RepID=A0AAD5QZA5_PARTN|nr:hypothetical protein KIN20_027208 [Parelaphostrongylus tenuis]